MKKIAEIWSLTLDKSRRTADLNCHETSLYFFIHIQACELHYTEILFTTFGAEAAMSSTQLYDV
jgi:hypothetical protein